MAQYTELPAEYEEIPVNDKYIYGKDQLMKVGVWPWKSVSYRAGRTIQKVRNDLNFAGEIRVAKLRVNKQFPNLDEIINEHLNKYKQIKREYNAVFVDKIPFDNAPIPIPAPKPPKVPRPPKPQNFTELPDGYKIIETPEYKVHKDDLYLYKGNNGANVTWVYFGNGGQTIESYKKTHGDKITIAAQIRFDTDKPYPYGY